MISTLDLNFCFAFMRHGIEQGIRMARSAGIIGCIPNDQHGLADSRQAGWAAGIGIIKTPLRKPRPQGAKTR